MTFNLRKSKNGCQYFTIDKAADYFNTDTRTIVKSFCDNKIPWPTNIASVADRNRIVCLDTKTLKESVSSHFAGNNRRGAGL